MELHIVDLILHFGAAALVNLSTERQGPNSQLYISRGQYIWGKKSYHKGAIKPQLIRATALPSSSLGRGKTVRRVILICIRTGKLLQARPFGGCWKEGLVAKNDIYPNTYVHVPPSAVCL